MDSMHTTRSAVVAANGQNARAVLFALLVFAAVVLGWPASALAMDNAACTSCHSATMDMSVPAVDRDVVCKSCHLGFAGSHPFHQVGANCGAACHPQWGDSLLTATPRYIDPLSGAAFASSVSKSMPAEELHVIHSVARWPADVSASGSACASCHSIAACTACHTGAISAAHASHSAVGTTALPAQTPWTGAVGYGVVGGDQSQLSAFEDSNQCATSGCHDLASTQAARPHFVEDYNHAVGGNPDAPTLASNAISTTGTWRTRSNTVYTGSRMTYSNAAGSSLSASFTGSRVEIVSDLDPYRGQADVFIDDVYAETVDFYAPMTKAQAIVFSRDVAQGPHTIKVSPTGLRNVAARGAYVVIDAFNVYLTSRGSVVPRCSSCHVAEDAGHESLHIATVSASCSGGGCHAGTNLVPLHINAETTLSCGSCHDSLDGGIVGAIQTGNKSCEACHAGQPHPNFEAAHTSTTNAGCFGAGCHDASKSLPTVHAAFAGPASENPEYATTCALCHANPTVNTQTSGTACTGACHTITTHSNMSVGHTVTAASAACTSCHGTDVNTIHGAYSDMTRCAWCHSQPSNWSKSGNCVNCHSMATPHPDLAAPHAVTAIGGGDIYMGLNDGDHNGVSIWEACDRAGCHYTDLVVVHASQCQWCHTSGGAPTAPGGVWNKSCQQGGCHPTIHATMLATDNHFGAYWNSSASCDVCHDGGDPWPGSGDNCQACH